MQTNKQLLGEFKKLKVLSKKHLNFDNESFENNFNVTINTSKWIDLKQKYAFQLLQIEKELQYLYRELFQYYKTEYPLNIETKEQLKLFIETDDQYRDKFETYKLLKQIISFIEDVLDGLKNKLWEMKYYIDWQKFINGVN